MNSYQGKGKKDNGINKEFQPGLSKLTQEVSAKRLLPPNNPLLWCRDTAKHPFWITAWNISSIWQSAAVDNNTYRKDLWQTIQPMELTPQNYWPLCKGRMSSQLLWFDNVRHWLCDQERFLCLTRTLSSSDRLLEPLRCGKQSWKCRLSFLFRTVHKSWCVAVRIWCLSVAT